MSAVTITTGTDTTVAAPHRRTFFADLSVKVLTAVAAAAPSFRTRAVRFLAAV